MFSNWSSIISFFANIAGVSAFLALFVPSFTDWYINRVSEKYRLRLSRELEEFKKAIHLDTEKSLYVFKEGLRETANKQERLRIHLEQIMDFISLSRGLLKSAVDNSQRLNIARKLLDDISKYEQVLRETGFYSYNQRLDRLTEEDQRLHQDDGDEWFSDLEALLYLFLRDVTLFSANLGHYGQSTAIH